MHLRIATALNAKFPSIPLILRVERGQTGVDVTVPDRNVPVIGFKYGEIKPNSQSGQRTFDTQVQRWKDSGKLPQDSMVQPITYDAHGNVYFGFKLNKTKK